MEHPWIVLGFHRPLQCIWFLFQPTLDSRSYFVLLWLCIFNSIFVFHLYFSLFCTVPCKWVLKSAWKWIIIIIVVVVTRQKESLVEIINNNQPKIVFLITLFLSYRVVTCIYYNFKAWNPGKWERSCNSIARSADCVELRLLRGAQLLLQRHVCFLKQSVLLALRETQDKFNLIPLRLR